MTRRAFSVLVIAALFTASTASADSAFYETLPGVAIADDSCGTGFFSTISVPVAGTITDVDVGILVTHTWRGDVHLRLRSPDGTEIALYYDLTSTYGDDANNLYGTFDASSVNTPADGFDDTVADYTNREFTTLDGSTLTTDLNDFIGKGTLGTWTLKYCDKASPDTGTLDGWGLYLFYTPGAPTTTTTSTTTTTTSPGTTTTTSPGTTTTMPGTTTTVPATSSTTTTTDPFGDDDDDDFNPPDDDDFGPPDSDDDASDGDDDDNGDGGIGGWADDDADDDATDDDSSNDDSGSCGN